ncbi:hypothetical protein BME96_06160 [Virgibacillus halodenitrificans]|uniref:site-specific DNA-methyltransferase (adenine-specific) n=1 Tax=Virgibacillus halodenitrificans TaxID=1482 RepID=A0AAC9J0S8_VIRHA|nr:BREX-1 system adenine-specific DNA-methyltransferase PglX [Virgibacillus halodenitrificans]APC47780.1 hypothetical protein BME96_06160 [Virgibacillus halodenitrificans]
MKPEQKKAINRTILKCREILESDIENRLVTCGILLDEPWIEKDKLSLSDEEEQIYKDLRDAISKEMKGGLSEKEALISYIREVTYTYLNRIAALRVMEVRGLMEEVLIQREEYSNRSYGHRNFFEVAREFCKSQSDEGLSYFISLIFNEISSDIGLLFNTEDEYSIIGPSNQALLEIIHQLTTEIDEESWQQDEIIGWIYQYFNEEEKDDVFDRLYNKKEKIKSIDIPAATQLFTPDWIVDWIINNSLGKLHEEIINGEREHKKLEEIKLLDPACGSGHFLIKAYDLFYRYYVEEGYSKEKIPFLILSNNLHGIDIDARAIQLTALILYIKVRVSLKEAGINEVKENELTVNLVCADAVLLNGERLAKMKKQFENNPTVLQMIEIIYDEFTDTRIKGSLIQPEKQLLPLIEEYKQEKHRKFKKKVQKEDLGLFEGLDEFVRDQEESILSKGEQELFQYLEQIYTQAVKAKDINNLLFASEVKKSVYLLNIFMNKYDLVVGNPPYLGKRNMNETLKKYLQKHYKKNFVDLYSSFIERSMHFLSDDGLLGMVTQQSFMFTSNFESLREEILSHFSIRSVCHLGTNAFDEISGAKVNTVMFVFAKTIHDKKFKGKYIRLINFDTPKSKQVALMNDAKDHTYYINQEDFKNISGMPFVYWASNEILSLFKTKIPLEKYAIPRQGMATGDNSRFLKYFWEFKDLDRNKWKPYSKVIDNSEYYTFYPTVVYWENNGEEIRKHKSSAVRGETFFGREGIMYSLIGNRFKSRYLPSGFIFDKGNSCIFPEKISNVYLLAFTNSKLFTYIIKLLNPTHNFQVGDLKRIPIVEPSDDSLKNIEKIINKIRDNKMEQLSRNELSVTYDPESVLKFKRESFIEFLKNQIITDLFYELEEKYYSEQIDHLIYDIYGISEKDIYNIENEIEKSYFTKSNQYVIEDIEEYEEEIIAELSDNVFNIYSLLRSYSIDPFKLLNFIKNRNIISAHNYIEKFFEFLSSILRKQFDSDSNSSEKEFIILDNEFVEGILLDEVELLSKEENIENDIEELEAILGSNILGWILKEFFKRHVGKFKNRPIYWHICSPNKNFNSIINYYAITPDTLYKLKSNHLIPFMNSLSEDIVFYREKMTSSNDKKLAKQFEKRVIDLEKQINDLETFDKQIDEIIASGYEPDIDQGVLYNIKPLNPILAKKIEK